MVEITVELYDFTKEEIRQFNNKSGIYAIIHNDKVLYVGQSTNLGDRLRHHRSENALQNTINSIVRDVEKSGYCGNRCKAIAMYSYINDYREEIQFTILKETNDLDFWEEHYITLFKPKYNYQGVDVPYKRAAAAS